MDEVAGKATDSRGFFRRTQPCWTARRIGEGIEVDSTPPENCRPDTISLIATIGAPFLVGSLLLYRIINGQWGSVAFMAVAFAVVVLLYIRFVPLNSWIEDRDCLISSDSTVELDEPVLQTDISKPAE